jgi:hypothetical protein
LPFSIATVAWISPCRLRPQPEYEPSLHFGAADGAGVGVGGGSTGVGVATGSGVFTGVDGVVGAVRGATSRARFFSTGAEGADAGWAVIGLAIGGAGAGVAAAIGGGAGATGRGRSAALSCSAADRVRAYPAV